MSLGLQCEHPDVTTKPELFLGFYVDVHIATASVRTLFC